LFVQKKLIQYFAVIRADQIYNGVEQSQEYIFRHANAPENIPDNQSVTPPATNPENTEWEALRQQFQNALVMEEEKYTQLEEP
jgi:hypothetical protein